MEAIGQLTGGVAHDFNNLLMVIKGSIELLRKRLPQDTRALHLLDNAQQGADRGIALTQRMLAFAHRQELKLGAVDIPALVSGMSDLIMRSLDSNMELELRLPEGLAPVWADANQLELALLNLVVNARDAMPNGGNIVIAARETPIDPMPDAPRFVCLSVIDSGEGMDAETLARATEPFFTTKGVGKGTGLGLPMVHGVAHQSGGRLILKSEKGHGTTAELWLPCSEAAVAEPTAPAAIAAPASVRPLAVLLVDDDVLVLHSAAAMLEDLGHGVISANSGEQALRLLEQHPEVDMVITDQAMPRMTGAELAAAARTMRPQLPIVVASGYAELPGGSDSSLTRLAKPFTQTELTDAIRQAIRACGQ